MGRRRNRKQERRAAQGRADVAPPRRSRAVLDPAFFTISDDDLGVLAGELERRTQTPTCGNCREFVPDEDAGRGECLHPGSGILMPWPDTPPCAFHTPATRIARP